MMDACYTSSAVEIAVELANTWMPVRGEDHLETVEQLGDFLDRHLRAEQATAPRSAAGRAGSRRRLTETDLAEVRALRDTVRDVLERAGSDAAGAAALINDGLRRCHAVPTLRHDHDHWRTDVTSDSDRSSAQLAATTLGALASVIATLGPDRLGVCAGSSCRATFVDLSRNGSKQFCTRTCAHRASVAAYRSRRRPS